MRRAVPLLLAIALVLALPVASQALTWSAPQTIDGGALASISCQTRRSCLAGDYVGNLVALRSGTWSAPVAADPSGAIMAISCPVNDPHRFCVAVESTGKAFVVRGTTPSPPVTLGPGQQLSAVSCPSATFCAAVDTGGNAFVFNGSSWSAATNINGGAAPLDAVSCASATFCVAVDFNGTAFTYDGSAWSGSTTIAPAAVQSVSCPTTAFCAATDSSGDAIVKAGSTWSAPQPVFQNTGYPVSCASAAFCVALGIVDAQGDSGASTWNGSAWSIPASIDSAGPTTAVSCPAAGTCAAIDGTGHVVASGSLSAGCVKVTPRCDEPLSLLPPPVAKRTFNAARVKGRVRVRLPGSHRFRRISQARHLPVGAVIDTTHGTVRIVSAKSHHGTTQSARFHSGQFRLRQKKRHVLYTDLRLVGPFGPCPSGHPAATARHRRHRRHRRRLWGNGHGNFATFTQDSGSLVTGTHWLTEQRCDGTLTVVRRGTVKVHDFRRHRTIAVSAGHRYLARSG